jgi:MFS family permease
MADEKKSVEATSGTQVEAAPAPVSTTTDSPARPAGWQHKGFRIFGKEYWYASPIVQLLLVSFVCFLCPGMFNALSGLGGGGQVDAKASDDALTALYSTFAVVAFFSGSIANKLGIKVTLSIGGLGYCIYAASFLSYNHNGNAGFVVFAGAFLGVCAGLLWTAQGTIMMSYPSEDKKGRYISLFWMIFNLGAVLGSLIPLAQSVNQTSGSASDGVYAAFIVLMFLGAVIALFLCNAGSVIRPDGTKIILMKNPSWVSEFKGLVETFTSAPWIVLLFPMFFASNAFYTWQFNDFLGAHFNIRTRSLNNLLYWMSQIFGALIFGHGLDFAGVRRSMRAKVSFIVLFVLTMVIWGGAYAAAAKQDSRDIVEGTKNYVGIDWTDGGEKFLGPMFLYMFFGFYDAAWQTCIYW